MMNFNEISMKLIHCTDDKKFLKEKPKKNQSIFLLNKEVTIELINY